jgi:VanZ family protein
MHSRLEGSTESRLSGGLRAVGALLQRIPRRWAWIPVLGWMALIFHLSSRPSPDLGGPGSVASWGRNCAHAVEYGMLALLSALCLPRAQGWPDIDKRRFLTLLALIVLWAASDEWHQSLTPHRDASVCDALTDAVGAAATLSTIAFAGGSRASDEKLVRALFFGLSAVLLAGALATFLPALFPSLDWL